MISPLFLLQCLLYMNFNGQQVYHFTTQHCFAKNSGSRLRAYNHVCNTSGVTSKEVEETKTFFGSTPFAWFVGAGDDQTISMLCNHGLSKVAEFPALCADISVLPQQHSIVDLVLMQVTSESDIAEWNCLVASIYRYDPVELARATEYLCHAGCDAVRLYLGWYENKPVSVGMAIYHGDIVTLHKIGTLPEYRNRGFGYALTHTILLDAVHSGCTMALLTATSMGKSLYDRFGFTQCGFYYVYALVQ